MEKETLISHEPVAPLRFVKVRCPQCFKLFSVNPTEIQDAKPKFGCNSCQTKFWMSYPECLDQGELIGFPVEWLESAEETDDDSSSHEARFELKAEIKPRIEQSFEENKAPVPSLDCPKCKHTNQLSNKECVACGVIFSKYQQARNESNVPAPKEVKVEWERVIENYDNRDVHQEFVRRCLREDLLDYASSKYKQVLEVQPNDEMAKLMTKELIALALVRAPITENLMVTKKKKRKIPFLWLVIFLSTSVIVFGFFIPELRNLVGLGASILFLTLTIKYYFLRA